MKDAAPQIERFVDTAEVALFLDKPESWIYNNSERLALPRHRIGRQLRYRLSEIEEWVRNGAGEWQAGEEAGA